MEKKTITICSSASFYKDVVEIAEQLKKRGFKVKIPKTASKMKRNNNFNVDDYKLWLKDDSLYRLKKKLMDDHFKKVIDCDAVLVINNKKKNIKGYIGGNVLMEMTLAYHYKIPIFTWEKTDNSHLLYEEIKGLNPIFINKDLTQIKL